MENMEKSNSWLNSFYLWFQTLHLWFNTIFCQMDDWKHSILLHLWRRLKNCNLRALYCLDVVQIHNQTVLFISRKDELYQVVLYLFQINVLRHNHLHYHQDHLWYLFQDLDYLTWACALLANSNNCIFTIFIQSEISNVIPNALLATIQSQSCFNNAKILQIMFASVTPIGLLEKMQSYSTCSTSNFSRSHLCWKSSWATSVPFVSCKEREQKRVKMYHF